jgi:transposase-like protein
MDKRRKFSKEIKIQACKDYMSGKGSFESIGKEIGCYKNTVLGWYYKYKIHGEKAFEERKRNNVYSKEFKLSIVKEYIEGTYTSRELSSMYNINESVIHKWIKKYYNGIELKNYNFKGENYSMKSRKVLFEERLEIVKWVIENNMNYKEAAIRYGINYANVYKWTKLYLKHGEEGLKDKRRGPKKIDLDSLSEVERLKYELKKERELRKFRELEIEILKKKEELEKHYQKYDKY